MNKHDARHAQNLAAAHVAAYVARLEGDAPTGGEREAAAFDIADRVLAELSFPAPADTSETTEAQAADENFVIDTVAAELDAQLDTRWA